MDKEEIKIEAINLKFIKLATGRILTVYSKEYGLMKLSGSSLGGRSDSFVRNFFYIKNLNFHNNSHEIFQIKASEFQQNFPRLKLNLDCLSQAWQYAEIIEKCSHFQDEQSQEIFSLFLDSLIFLEKISLENSNQENLLNNIYRISCIFFWKIIKLLGYEPSIENIQENKIITFSTC